MQADAEKKPAPANRSFYGVAGAVRQGAASAVALSSTFGFLSAASNFARHPLTKIAGAHVPLAAGLALPHVAAGVGRAFGASPTETPPSLALDMVEPAAFMTISSSYMFSRLPATLAPRKFTAILTAMGVSATGGFVGTTIKELLAQRMRKHSASSDPSARTRPRRSLKQQGIAVAVTQLPAAEWNKYTALSGIGGRLRPLMIGIPYIWRNKVAQAVAQASGQREPEQDKVSSKSLSTRE
jgi:hypothetical protein